MLECGVSGKKLGAREGFQRCFQMLTRVGSIHTGDIGNGAGRMSTVESPQIEPMQTRPCQGSADVTAIEHSRIRRPRDGAMDLADAGQHLTAR